ncbi:MAG: endonuclease III [Candidatus Pacearchaeota archaeon]
MDSQIAIRQLNELSKNNKEMRLAAEEWKNDFQILVSTIMSARTRDEVTIPVAENLFKNYPTAEKLSKASLNDIKKIIRPVNFYNNKATNVLNCAKMLISKYSGEVPHDIDKLITLPGVGRKTANVFLIEVGNEGLAVDTHVAYCSRKLEWTKNINPHKIEIDLKSLFPKKYWNKINDTLVRFGKTHTSRKEKDEILDEIRKIK